jgi:hypothetical protein
MHVQSTNLHIDLRRDLRTCEVISSSYTSSDDETLLLSPFSSLS